ncbi:AP endonuclease, family 2 [Mytilinidion resinicola]|uniref:AP endonuclease, family 2 n=1 Tax=Mytilinidion resinicola TaxID=574789 RepID=A0A6A6XZY0_9PEZI|nr:AP endonuclease, family 2 [Mytilinidion resinicola]KAF2801959.1 AP endonuclease, family 2 [Mytilinidion resinicola]
MKAFENKCAISTSSLGLHPSHSLDRKIHAAASHGFKGIEIVHVDLKDFSTSRRLHIESGADQIRQLCREKGLEILSLCPFENFEGHKSPLEERLNVAADWIKISRILGATYLQVPAQFSKDAVHDEALIVSELQQLADLGSAAAPVISIAYEPMSWSVCYSTWQDSLRLANLVNRSNFGICLDTFHVASKIWGNPYDTSGKYPDADEILANSLRDFVQDFLLEKLFYVQLSDGERFHPPFSDKHPWYIEGEAAEFTWSKHARPFPLEAALGGCMPVKEMVQAWVLEKGFRGWVSLESFDRRMRDRSVDPEHCAARAENSMQRLHETLCSGKSSL